MIWLGIGNDHGSAHEVDRPLYRTVLEYSEIGIPYRTRPSAFFNIIIARAIAEMDSIDSKDIFSLWHTMCYLRIPWKMEEVVFGHCLDLAVKPFHHHVLLLTQLL